MKAVCRDCDIEQAPGWFGEPDPPCFNCGEPVEIVPGMLFPGPWRRMVAMTTADLLAL